MSIPQNKGFLPSIIKANKVKKKIGNKNDKILCESENNSPAKRATERLYDHKVSESVSTLFSSKSFQKATVISPCSSIQFIKNGFTIVNSINKIKEPIPDTSIANILNTTPTSRTSRFQLSGAIFEKDLSKDLLKHSLSPCSQLINSSESRLSKSLNQRPKKHEFSVIIKHKKPAQNLYLPSMDNIHNFSLNSLEEKKSDENEFNSCEEDDIGENDTLHSCNDLVQNQQKIEISIENCGLNYGLNTIQISNNQINLDNKILTPDTGKKPEDPKKKKKGYSALSEMLPVNLEKEQQTFFINNFKYNPIFEYSSTNIKQQFSKPHTKFLKIAKLILNKCIEEHGSDEIYLEKTGGRLITREETTIFFEKYIKELGLEEYLTLVFSENTVPIVLPLFLKL